MRETGNVQGGSLSRHEHPCHLRQVFVSLAVKTVPVGSCLQELIQHRHILRILRHLNAHAFLVNIAVQVAVIRFHPLEDFIVTSRKVNDLRVCGLNLAG